MIHAAVEQCGEGDVLVVTTTSPSTDGLFGELFATALKRRGVRGVVINAGIRDTRELREMGFAAWSVTSPPRWSSRSVLAVLSVRTVRGNARWAR